MEQWEERTESGQGSLLDSSLSGVERDSYISLILDVDILPFTASSMTIDL